MVHILLAPITYTVTNGCYKPVLLDTTDYKLCLLECLLEMNIILYCILSEVNIFSDESSHLIMTLNDCSSYVMSSRIIILINGNLLQDE